MKKSRIIAAGIVTAAAMAASVVTASALPLGWSGNYVPVYVDGETLDYTLALNEQHIGKSTNTTVNYDFETDGIKPGDYIFMLNQVADDVLAAKFISSFDHQDWIPEDAVIVDMGLFNENGTYYPRGDLKFSWSDDAAYDTVYVYNNGEFEEVQSLYINYNEDVRELRFAAHNTQTRYILTRMVLNPEYPIDPEISEIVSVPEEDPEIIEESEDEPSGQQSSGKDVSAASLAESSTPSQPGNIKPGTEPAATGDSTASAAIVLLTAGTSAAAVVIALRSKKKSK